MKPSQLADKLSASSFDAPIPGTAGAMCPKCGRIHPLAYFERKLTKREARAKGYAAKVPVVIDSSVCKDCQPRRKKPSEMTIKELITRKTTGEVPTVMAEDLIAKRKREKTTVRSLNAQKRWRRARGELWEPIREALCKELTRVVQQAKHASNRVHVPETVAFLKFYANTLRYARNDIDIQQDRAITPTLANVNDWRSCVTAEARNKVAQAWDSIPLEQRMALRRPPVLLSFRPNSIEANSPSNTNKPRHEYEDYQYNMRIKPKRSARGDEVVIPSVEKAKARQNDWLLDE